ncbi:Nse4 [Kluyveromyces lactis]|nr:Nse4 [Kluyveromyces lactis]
MSEVGNRRSSKRRRTEAFTVKVDKEEERKEFDIIRRYRALEHEVQHDRLQITRDGDVRVMSKRLDEIEHLFGDLQSLNVNKNAVLAQDSKAMKTISELLSLSMSTVKFDESGRLIKLEDILNSAKKFMLKEYLEVTGMTEPEYDGNMEEEELADETHEPVNEFGDTRTSEVDNDDVSAFKNRQKRSNYLSQFGKYTEFNQFNWFKMGTLYQNLSHTPFTIDHMLGPLYVEKTVRKQREIRARDPVAELSTAERVTKESLNESQDETTPSHVRKCYKVLKEKEGGQQINLFKYIIDPNSFSKSVENLFYTSFLIKEGRLVLEDDPDGYPAVRIKEQLPDDSREREIEKQRRNDSRQNHIIFQMDMPTWRKLIKKFNITEPFLNKDT